MSNKYDSFQVDLTNLEWLNIELSSKCNLRCRWCILDHDKDPQYLDLELLERILTEVSGGKFPRLQRIDFHNGGETLLHPDADKALKIIGDFKAADLKDIHIALLTNGTVLKSSVLKVLTERKVVDEIRFSIDGGNRQFYEYIRVGANWNKVSSNVERLIMSMREAGVGTKVGVICMVPPGKPQSTEWMSDEFLRVIEMADQVEIRSPHSWEGSLPEEVEIKAAWERKNSSDICKFLRKNLVVLASGQVTVCCADLLGRGDLGNLHDITVEQALIGGERRRMINLWESGNFKEISLCAPCEGYYD